jgi:hypothetical protein
MMPEYAPNHVFRQAADGFSAPVGPRLAANRRSRRRASPPGAAQALDRTGAHAAGRRSGSRRPRGRSRRPTSPTPIPRRSFRLRFRGVLGSAGCDQGAGWRARRPVRGPTQTVPDAERCRRHDQGADGHPRATVRTCHRAGRSGSRGQPRRLCPARPATRSAAGRGSPLRAARIGRPGRRAAVQRVEAVLPSAQGFFLLVPGCGGHTEDPSPGPDLFSSRLRSPSLTVTLPLRERWGYGATIRDRREKNERHPAHSRGHRRNSPPSRSP